MGRRQQRFFLLRARFFPSSWPTRIARDTKSAIIPGETNLYLADAFVINKVDTAEPENVLKVRENLSRINPNAVVIEAASPLFVDDPAAIHGKRVLVIEDGSDSDARRNEIRRRLGSCPPLWRS